MSISLDKLALEFTSKPLPIDGKALPYYGLGKAGPVVSLERLLFARALAMQEPRYQGDLALVVERVLQLQYRDDREGERGKS